MLGGTIWRCEPDFIRIANMLWVNIAPRRYVFAYNHETEKIEIRDRTQTGAMLHAVDDANSPADIETIFRGL